MPSTTRSQTRAQQPRITEQSTTTVESTPRTKKPRTPRTGGRTRTPSRPNYVAVTVAVSAPYEDLSEEEEEEEKGFESWNTDRYAAMEQPVKSYCLDMIAHCQATGEDMYYGGLRDLLDQTRIFARYRNWDAQYDACFYRIPLDEWVQQTGLTREQTEQVANCFGSYMGSMHFDEFSRKGRPLVTIWGDS